MFKKSVFIVLLISLVGGCSSKFAYNNLDWLLYWYLDDYVELEGEQKNAFDKKLGEWLAWHRTSELKQYRTQLEQLKGQLQTGTIDQQQILQAFETSQRHWVRLRDHLAPQLMPFAVELSDAQVEHLFNYLQEQDQKRIKKRNKKTQQERLVERRKSMQKEFKKWAGKPNRQQLGIIEQYTDQFQSTFLQWMSYRKQMQEDAKKLFITRDTDLKFKQKLLELMTNPKAFQSREYQEKQQHNSELYAQMLLELNASLNVRQQKKLVSEMDDLIDDLTDLIEG